MRQRLIEALAYPRSCVLNDINLRDCPFDGVFELFSDRCKNCDLGKECHWLRCLRKDEELAGEPTHTIHATLLFGLSLIEANNRHQQHDSEWCTCESCTWARNTRELEQEFKILSLADRFRSVY
jgi:hypothetical protein